MSNKEEIAQLRDMFLELSGEDSIVMRLEPDGLEVTYNKTFDMLESKYNSISLSYISDLHIDDAHIAFEFANESWLIYIEKIEHINPKELYNAAAK